MKKVHPANLDNFFDITKNDVDKMIESIIDNKKIVKILTAGKRLRPLVAKLSFKVCTGGKETPYHLDVNIEYRSHYVEGAGQLCKQCWDGVYESEDERIYLVGEYLIKETRNNYELGEKVRQMYNKTIK